MNIKFGRAFWTLGSLNAQHSHSDNFADRPLPYRAFLDKAFNDDGLEVSYRLPVDFYAVVGAGSFRGNDFPFGLGEEAEAGNEGKSGYIRVGSNLTEDSSWRAGAYMFQVMLARAKQVIHMTVNPIHLLHLVVKVIYTSMIFDIHIKD